MVWFEQKYIGLISCRLDKFRRINNQTYNFRCPICGDSQKNRSKTRGYLFEKNRGNGFLYHCHNCNITMGLDKFIQEIDPSLFGEFLKEKLENSFNKTERKLTDVEVFANKMKTPTFIRMTALKNLKKISQLEWNHPAKIYINNRKIPNPWHSRLFYCPRFKQFVNTLIPDKFENVDNDEPRLIIPFIDMNNDLFGFSGRSFNPASKLKYITIILNNEQPKIFNLDKCDRTKPHYVVEGPIDCMFLSNAMAMAGASVANDCINENSILVFDNEPRAKETCKRIEKAIEKGHKVVIFPSDLKEKDINDMALASIDFEGILCNNIYKGIEAFAVFNQWKRI